MAYSYKCPIGGSGESYISFNVQGSFTPGESISVEGEIYNGGYYMVNEISFQAWPESIAYLPVYGEHYVSSDAIAVNVAKGKSLPFNLALTVPDLSGSVGSSRASALRFGFINSYSVRKGEMATEECAEVSGSRLYYLRYRWNPGILEMDFERCGPSGAWQDDGQYFRCKRLRISKNPQASVGELTEMQILCAGTDGSSRSFNLTASQVSAALTSSGYSEAGYGSSNVFYGFTSALGVTYTLTLTMGDPYDQAAYTDKVARAFARLHLSGAENGGVAIGMFSSATDAKPKFEVADTHESHFYGPVFFEGDVSGIGGAGDYQEGEVDTGGKWIDGKPIYRYIYSGTVKMTSDATDLTTLPHTVESLIAAHGFMELASNKRIFSIPTSHPGGAARAVGVVVTEDNVLRLNVGSGMTGTNRLMVMLEYTSA